MSNKLRSLSAVCQHHPHLQQLNRRAQKLTQLDLILQAVLPSQFVGRCQLVNLEQQRLILMVDSAPIASLIRFQSSKLIRLFTRQHQIPVDKVQVIVRPLQQRISTAPQQAAPQRLSKDTSRLLRETAENLDNPALQKALTRLSGRVK